MSFLHPPMDPVIIDTALPSSNNNDSATTTPVPRHARPIIPSVPPPPSPFFFNPNPNDDEERIHAASIVAHQHRSHHLSHITILPSTLNDSHSPRVYSPSSFNRSELDPTRRIHSHPIYAAERREREEARSKVSAWRAGVRINNGDVSPERTQGLSSNEDGEAGGATAGLPDAPNPVEGCSALPRLHHSDTFNAFDDGALPNKKLCSSGEQSNDSGSDSDNISGQENARRSGAGVQKACLDPERKEASAAPAKVDTQKKKVLAERMLDTMHNLLCSTWPEACSFDSPSAGSSPSSPTCEEDSMSGNGSGGGLMPLRGFIREILRRSKSSCMTLKAAEWYLMRLRRTLALTTPSAPSSSLPEDSPLHCPRRAFLAALVLAHKFLHDRVYSNRAWAKASGLDTCEVSKAELALGCMLDWRLWVGKGDEEDEVPLAHDAGPEVQCASSAESYTPLDSCNETPASALPGRVVVGRGLACGSAFANAYAASPSSIEETAQSCSSAQSSPQTGFDTSRPPSVVEASGRNHVHPASTFTSMGGSFASISPEAMHHHGQPGMAHHTSIWRQRQGTGSTGSIAVTAFSLSVSMPSLSIGSTPTESGLGTDVVSERHSSADTADEDAREQKYARFQQGGRSWPVPRDQNLPFYHHPHGDSHRVTGGHKSSRDFAQIQTQCPTGMHQSVSGGTCRKRGALGCVLEESRNGSVVGMSTGMAGHADIDDCARARGSVRGVFGDALSLKRRKTREGGSVSTSSEYEGSPVPCRIAVV